MPMFYRSKTPRHCLHEYLCPKEWEHRTTGSGWKGPLRFTESSPWPNTTMPTRPWHWVPRPVFPYTSPGTATPPPSWAGRPFRPEKEKGVRISRGDPPACRARAEPAPSRGSPGPPRHLFGGGPAPRSPLTAERRRLQRGPRGAVDDFDGAARGHGQDGVERRVVAQAAEPVGVAAQAAVPQQQPLAGARTGTGPRRRRRRGAGGRRSHLRGRRRRRPQDKRPAESRSLTVPGAAAASHHPGPGRGGKGERPREREVTQPRRMRNRAAAAGGGAGAMGPLREGRGGAALRACASPPAPARRWLRSRGHPRPRRCRVVGASHKPGAWAGERLGRLGESGAGICIPHGCVCDSGWAVASALVRSAKAAAPLPRRRHAALAKGVPGLAPGARSHCTHRPIRLGSTASKITSVE